MKRLKNIMSVVFALYYTIAITFSFSINVNALSDEELYTEIKDTLKSINTSKLYYDKNTDKFYIKAIKNNLRGMGIDYDIWLYEINDKGIAKETNRLKYSFSYLDNKAFFHYSINFDECSIDEFYKQYSLYDDKYTEIDAEQGMTKLNLNDITLSTDYSYLSNIILDIDSSQKLLPKVILNEKDNLKITWSSSDNSVATVDSDGNVTAKNSGSCTVSAKLEGLDESIAEYTIKVNTNDETLFKVYEFVNSATTKISSGYQILDIDNDNKKEILILFKEPNMREKLSIYSLLNGEFTKIIEQEFEYGVMGYASYIKKDNNFYAFVKYAMMSQYSFYNFDKFLYQYSDRSFNKLVKLHFEGLGDGKIWTEEQQSDWFEVNKMITNKVPEYVFKIDDKDVTYDEYIKQTNYFDEMLKYSIDFMSMDTNPLDFVFYDSNIRLLTQDELQGMNKKDIEIAINEIYARHGYIFKNEELSNYFNEKSWYHENIKDMNSIQLNSCENENLKLLSKYR